MSFNPGLRLVVTLGTGFIQCARVSKLIDSKVVSTLESSDSVAEASDALKTGNLDLFSMRGIFLRSRCPSLKSLPS